jgi:carboxymethylenebutenolidase
MALPTSNPLIAGGAIESSEVEIPAEKGSLKAYLAKPAGSGNVPGIVVIHENRGLVAFVRDVTDGLASSGYMAVAPDLLTREGGTDAITDVPPVLSEIPRERHTADAIASIRYLQSQGAARVGIIGFCFGGGVVWRVATEAPDLAAAVPCYGSNPPLENVSNIQAAVYAVYGGQDERINAGIDDITAALKAAGTTCGMKVYDGAAHAFLNHTNADRYAEAAAKAAWADALSWLDKHLKA